MFSLRRLIVRKVLRNDLGIKSAELVRLSSLRVEQGVGDILGVLVGKFQAQRLRLVAILPDADRQNVQPRPGRLRRAGYGLHIDPRRRHIGDPQGARGFALLQDQRQRVGAIQLRDCRDRHRIGRLVGSAIDQPAQHPVGARRRRVKPFRRPQHPIFLVGKNLQCQQLAAVIGAVPADRAVAVGCDDQLPVTANIYGENGLRGLKIPEGIAVGGQRRANAN